MIVSDWLTENFPDIMNYDFTANVEKEFDEIAEGKLVWNSVIAGFYGGFHKKVEETLHDGQYSRVERELGTDPSDGKPVIAKYGQFGPYVQKGEGEGRQCASLSKGQLIENITLEEALSLFKLPRVVGEVDGQTVTVLKGRFGPYLKFGDKNISLPRGADPMSVSLADCEAVIRNAAATASPVISEFKDSDISVLNGRYGPYIKHAGSNYKIPKGTDAAALTEDDCKRIIAEGSPTSSSRTRRFKK